MAIGNNIGTLKSRHRILAFYGVPSTGEAGYVLKRMTGFTSLSMSKNPTEHTRQYVDEEFERSDVVGYATSISYAFDRHDNNAVQKDIISITDNEKIMSDAQRYICVVDTDTGEAILRPYSVIPDTEGDDINIYTYSGTFKVIGEVVTGTASSSDDWQNISFTTDSD